MNSGPLVEGLMIGREDSEVAFQVVHNTLLYAKQCSANAFCSVGRFSLLLTMRDGGHLVWCLMHALHLRFQRIGFLLTWVVASYLPPEYVPCSRQEFSPIM